ncbi:Smr/MutS family protein [Candidatus Pelagibacter communis]|uniref:Smr/MutS family protein n=1 Tax=Pelagibacter ubique TaxID=198252 RepID=UPI00094C6EB3|nr:Smr/MutS family protein [Candidatus Pelagibacter ubique]
MNKKLSNKDLKDWKNFVEGNEKVQNKDYIIDEIKYKQEATIDLHGFSLDQANSKVEKFIVDCFNKKVLKLNIITGKGLRSKVDQNPYQSKDLGILKYSVPEFIKSNTELMKIIKKVDDSTDEKNSGFFSVYLKL